MKEEIVGIDKAWFGKIIVCGSDTVRGKFG